jgi:hypothetical protein
MNQKGFANIIFVVVIVILLGAVGYFAFVKKSEPITQQPIPTPVQVTNTPKSNPTSTPIQKKIESLMIGVPTEAKDNPYKNVPSSQGNFSVIYQGREIKVEVNELEKVYYDGPCNSSAGIPCDNHNWTEFYNFVKNRDYDLGGMPLPTKLKGYFINENTFRVLEISWQVG